MANFKIKKPTKEKKKPSLGKKETVKSRANKTEADQAKRLGAQKHPASGALDGFKGDYSVKGFLFDSKETVGSMVTLSANDFTKLARDARESGKMPAMVLKINKMPSTVPNEWVSIPLEEFATILERLSDV